MDQKDQKIEFPSFSEELSSLTPPSFSSSAYTSSPYDTFASPFGDEPVYRSACPGPMVESDDFHSGPFASIGPFDDAAGIDLAGLTPAALSGTFSDEPNLANLTLDPKFAHRGVAAPSLGFPTLHSHETLDPKGAAASMTPALSEVLDNAEPPRVPGGYLEPSYHFFTESSPSRVLSTLLPILQAAQVDCFQRLEKYKVKCTAYRNGARLPFTVRVWLAPDGSECGGNEQGSDIVSPPAKYAVEFQRRSGDIFYFNELYRNAKRALHAQGLVDSELCAADKTPTPTAPALDAQITTEQAKETLKNLLQMASSKYVDVKHQALLALADLVNNAGAKVQSLMVATGVVELLAEELNCSNEDVHSCALTALATLCRDKEDVCKRAHDAGVITTLLSLRGSARLQVVRECARALGHIGSSLGTKVIDDNFRSALAQFRYCRDARAREYVAPLLESLRI